MVNRIAASLALVVFAICLIQGGLYAGNSLSTTIWRSLVAMAGTYCVGLALGKVAQVMLDENLRTEEEKLRKSQKTDKQ